MRAGLRRAYRATRYAVLASGLAQPFLLRAGKHHAGFDSWLKQQGARQAVLITAWNPASRQQTGKRNKAANAALAAWLKQRGYRLIDAENRAADPAWCEESLAVLDLPAHLTRALARRWRQNAVLFCRRGRRSTLLGTRRKFR